MTIATSSILPSVLLGREPHYAPSTDLDEHTREVARWLEEEGYANAALVLGVMVAKHHETVELTELKANPTARDTLLAASDRGECSVRIYSSEHRCYWRANGSCYSRSALEAGIYTFRDAWNRSSHCDASKGIVYEVLS